MNSKLQINKPLVSVNWLFKNFDASNLVVLDATMGKITATDTETSEKKQIKGARFFDIKYVFSDQNSELPNTVLTPSEFEKRAQLLGINSDSAIVVYDDIGVYSSPRVWWLFKSMGYTNVAVLDGGLPVWQKANFPIESPIAYLGEKGNFKANYNGELIYNSDKVLNAINNSSKSIVDARSKGRFNATELEPREEIRSGHIPSSINLPYTDLQVDGKMLEKEKLAAIFNDKYKNKVKVIFSCGSGITACILALGAELSGIENLAVYDGSWTEWGSNHKLPIEK